MLKLDQDQFITDYVTSFLATWGVEQYTLRGESARNERVPVQQAVSMARMAWYSLLEMGMGPDGRRDR